MQEISEKITEKLLLNEKKIFVLNYVMTLSKKIFVN